MFMAKSIESEAPFFNCGNMSKVRALVSFWVEVTGTFLDHRVPRDVHRHEAAKRLESMYDTICRGPDVLPEDMHKQLCEDCDAFLQHYEMLHNIASEKNAMSYHIVPKFHHLWHICNDSRINPRLVWTYGGEDYVGHIATLTKSCLKGYKRIKLPGMVMDKYAVGLTFQLKDMGEVFPQ